MLIAAGSLSLPETCVQAQSGFVLGFVASHWNVFTPWGLVGFVLF